MTLKNKVALVTGGAQGLGKAIALAMARAGADVVICDINPKTLPETEAEIVATGVRCRGIVCDVSSVESVAGLFKETVATFGTLDILVNNAALVQTGARNEEMRSKFYKMTTTPIPKESLGVTKDFTDEEWHKYWGVNVHGVFYCTREALRIMEPRRSGKIINIASVAGLAASVLSIQPTARPRGRFSLSPVRSRLRSRARTSSSTRSRPAAFLPRRWRPTSPAQVRMPATACTN